MRAIPVRDPTQVGDARRDAVAVAQSLGFDEDGAGRVAIVATELATNLVKHGGGGEVLISVFNDCVGSGVECLALDKGPGMANVAACLRDGHSATGTAGTGLGAITRLSDEFDIFSRPGFGTAILARLQQPRPSRAAPRPAPLFGAVSLPKLGEQVCGDAWRVQRDSEGRAIVIVADGLGHGPLAAEAAHEAVRLFHTHKEQAPAEILAIIHAGLRATRGAAVSIARIDTARSVVQFAGLGNVAGTVIFGGASRGMVAQNGTAGHVARRIQEFTYEFAGQSLVLLCSDGLRTRWSLEDYPGLSHRHPTVIAGVLYRDYGRGRDDVTVLAAAGNTR